MNVKNTKLFNFLLYFQGNKILPALDSLLIISDIFIKRPIGHGLSSVSLSLHHLVISRLCAASEEILIVKRPVLLYSTEMNSHF